MHPTLRQVSRKLHLWLAVAILIPSVIVFGSGILLQVKKQFDWVQPPTMKGAANSPTITFAQVLDVVSAIPQMQVSGWQHIDRIDVRPDKGIMKVVAANRWEAQLDAQTAAVLHLAYRRSDTIESIHDGSWFAEFAKLWLFLPSGIIVFVMWCTGVVLLVTTLKSKFIKHKVRSTQSDSGKAAR